MHGERRHLTWQERSRAFTDWRELGLTARHANALINAGYSSLDDLRPATDFDLKVMANIGDQGRLQLYRLLGRQPPAKLKSPAEIQSEFEREWRSRFGDDRFDRLLDEIVDIVGNALDKSNLPAAQALWWLARKRRASRDSVRPE